MRYRAFRQLLAGAMIALAAAGVFAQAKERLDDVKEKDLPAPVAGAFHSHRRALFVSGVKVTRDGSVVEYRLTLKGSRKTAMVVKPDGTVISFKVTVGGRSQAYRTAVEEPEPGRVLVESDPRVGTVTTFTVTPEGAGSRVRIETAWRVGGVNGLVQRLIVPPITRRLYRDELQRLDRYAREQELALTA